MLASAEILSRIPLFADIASQNYGALLSCIGGRTKQYAKGEFVSLTGDAIDHIGVILSGRVYILKEDVFGNRAILNNMGSGEIFGESFICSGSHSLTVSVQTAERSEILFLPFVRVIQSCSSACQFHQTLIKNMLVMVAKKNIKLIEKLEVTTKHSLREKVLTYLSQLAQEQKSITVTAPLGRIDLADFLGADRSALTRELNKMQSDGLIDYEKNRYTLHGTKYQMGK